MKKLLVLIPLTLFFIQCQKERDEYYDEPSWVEKPIYEVLQNEGQFGLYLQCVDRTQYAVSLKGNGLWTVFAPDDEAMNAYLGSKGYSSVDAIPQKEVEKIVAYSMLFNKYQFDQLSDVLSGGWDTLKSVKKRTPYYETIYRESNGTDSIWVVDPTTAGGYSTNDNNYKYLPFYLDRYFSTRPVPLTADDYNTFYPATPYTGKNIQGASVIKQDLQASNGIVHAINEVNEPLLTLEELLEDENYSAFRNLINMKGVSGVPYFYSYLTSADLTQYYQTMYPSRDIDNVYVKFYTGLAASINCERYYQTSEVESNGYTIFAPNNNAVQKFYDEVISDYYPSLESLSSAALLYFINAHIVTDMIWPGGYKSAMNMFSDFINGVGNSGPGLDKTVYTDIRPASNGFFYGSEDYVKNHFFETVYTEILLRPSSYSLMYNALNKYFSAGLLVDLVKCPLNGYTDEDFTILLPSDELLKADGFTWEWTGTAYGFRHAYEGTSGTTFADARMQRLIRSHVFRRIQTNTVDTRITDFNGNPSGEYDGYAYAINDYGDMIRYKDGKIQLLGNYDADDWVTATHVKTFSNGQVFAIDKLLQYSNCISTSECSEQNMLVYLKQAAAANPNISKYVAYMEYFMTNTFNPYALSRESFWTLLMPNNAALDQAVADGHILSLEDLQATTTATNLEPLADAIAFFQYHIISGTLYPNDGYDQMLLNSGAVQATAIVNTALRILIENTYLRLEKSGGNLLISSHRSKQSRTANVVPGVEHSNLFGPKSVMHEIDNYFIYESENE